MWVLLGYDLIQLEMLVLVVPHKTRRTFGFLQYPFWLLRSRLQIAYCAVSGGMGAVTPR